MVGLRFFLEDTFDILDERGDELFATCPFCGKGKNHFAMNIEKGVYNCFKCGKRGTLLSLVWNTQNKKSPRRSVKTMLNDYSDSISLEELEKLQNGTSNETFYDIDPPTSLIDVLDGVEDINTISDKAQRARSYLSSRGVNYQEWVNLNLCVGVYGKYNNRIIFPIIEDKQIKAFVARSFGGDGLRYIYSPRRDGWVPAGKLIFGFDNICTDTIIITEGIFDVLALAPLTNVSAIAILGKAMSTEQFVKICSKLPKKIIVLLDGGCIIEALKVGSKFLGVIPTVKLALLPNDTDPADDYDITQNAIANALDWEEVQWEKS